MILGIDSCSVTAAAALADGGRVLAESFENSGLTHSETLLPLILSTVEKAGKTLADIDEIAITSGPGSFTGLRIGIATAKGLAFARSLPCVGVSSLEAAACNFLDTDCTVCVCMDARRHQFYNAVFKSENGVLHRLTPDRAISAEALEKELQDAGQNVILAGDGAKLALSLLQAAPVKLCAPEKMYPLGSGVLHAAQGKKRVPPEALVPVYLRPSQAERELKLKRS